MARARGRVIVIGNEKGGTGKSTVAMHLAVALARAGHRVATIDTDARQGTLSRYVENRKAYAERRAPALPQTEHTAVHVRQGASEAEVALAFESALERGIADCAAVVVDTPGSATRLAALAHSRADVIVTPINDSFVDLDLLARVEGEDYRVLGPSRYAEQIFEYRKQRMRREQASIDWIVLRNRLSALDAINKRAMADVLHQLSRRIGFRQVPGFGERVVFRELFLKGLTLLDLRDTGVDVEFSMSHVAARREVMDLVEAVAEGPC